MLICILTKNVITSCSVTMMLFLHLEVKPLMTLTTRSEERRVGKECKSRWSAYHLKKMLGDRAEIAPAGNRVHRTHPRQEEVVTDPNARRMRQVGITRDVELGVDRLDHAARKAVRHRLKSCCSS